MTRIIDLSGQRFGQLLVIERAPNDCNNRTAWRCRCDCGRDVAIRAQHLTLGKSRTCGCGVIASIVRRSTKHGLFGTPEYNSWCAAKERCHNPNHPRYPDYGGRGIFVCDKWRHDFAAFLRDMGQRPQGTSLDRIDNDGHYEPGNVRWATTQEQVNNQRTNRWLTLAGETLTVPEWANRLGLKSSTIHRRLYLGWSPERALTAPLR